MSSFNHNFNAKVDELQRKLAAFEQTMKQMPHTSRFVCEAGKERRDGYISKSPKFYVFRYGQQLPEHLVAVKFGRVKLRCGHTKASEALETAKIDIINHGFNAFINVKVERLKDRKTDYVVGFPVLLVSKNYRGDVNLLIERCRDDFSDAHYCTVCTPQLDQAFEEELQRQRTPKHVHWQCRRRYIPGCPFGGIAWYPTVTYDESPAPFDNHSWTDSTTIQPLVPNLTMSGDFSSTLSPADEQTII